MGYDCTNHFPVGTKAKDVESFLLLLGYEKGQKGPFSGMNGTPYFFYDDKDYKYITGIYSELIIEQETGELTLWTRTTIWRSKFDSDFHNYTIKELRKRFGGYFVSDYGKNRYFKFDGPIREKAEAGVYKSYGRFINNIKRAKHFTHFSDLNNNEKYPIHNIDFIDSMNPKLLASNVLVPYILSAIEEFFRSTYIALLKYSDNKEAIIQNARIQGAELLLIDQGFLTVPEAVAKWMSFQEMNKVNQAFKQLDKRIDLHGSLIKPYGRKKENFWQMLTRIIELRHGIIHRAEMDTTYFPKNVEHDLKYVEKAIWRFYQHLVHIYDWNQVKEWEF
ncbi:hypothetical protein Q7I36_04295 [Aeromonas veronii]|uniref:hypothetical protein n=1 Tax=Aeromonas veronii TaxID=654 RepID=UPI00191D4A8D|nr:hypothetical protein [Aeromonas veronii]MBL0622232.1 hypothetical protein [Aeromonas veronii]